MVIYAPQRLCLDAGSLDVCSCRPFRSCMGRHAAVSQGAVATSKQVSMVQEALGKGPGHRCVCGFAQCGVCVRVSQLTLVGRVDGHTCALVIALGTFAALFSFFRRPCAKRECA